MQKDKTATSDLRPPTEDEQQVKERSAPPSEMDVGALCHELDVCKIELDQKNEELMRAQAKLAASEQKYRDLFEFVPIGYFTLESSGKILEANLAGASLLGTEQADLVNNRFQAYLSRDSLSEFNAFCRRVMESEAKETAEFQLNGTGMNGIAHLWVQIEARAIRDGIHHGFRMAVIDITERKQALKKIESLARFPEENPNPILRVTSEGILAFANQSSDPLLKAWDCQVGLKVPKDLREHVLGAIKSEEVSEIEIVIGESIYFLVITPIKNEGHVNIYGMDITERKAVELKLARELNKFKLLYNLTLEMSAENSLEENFTFIVDKSRQLLNADTSYIALLDERSQDVRMHTLSGIRTEAFKQMQLPLGKGLYGRVMETHQGYIIDDYLKTNDIKHVVDPIIADEGLVSGMAVPIQIKDLSLGVLYVFNRHKTQFTQEDLDSLSLLGNLAALEIIRNKSSNALKEQLNFLQQLLDAMPNPIFYKDTKGVYLGCNKAFETSTGLTKEKLVGKTVYELYNKDLADIYHEADNKLFRNPGVQVYDASMTHADGARRNVMFNKATYFNSDGCLAGLVGVILDITERKKIETALRESERRLADIINFLPDATMVIDKEGKVIVWNRAIEVLTGVKADDMLGKGNHEHALPFYGQRRPVLIDLVLKPKEEIEKSYTNLSRDGGTLVGEAYMPVLGGGETYLWGVASALYDSRGNIVGAIESIKDITDRKRAEEALKESECRLADIINFLPDATMVIDRDGKVISWNQAIEAMTGVKAENILGKGNYEHALPFYGQRRPILIDLVLKSQEGFEKNYYKVERKGGNLVGEAYIPNLKGTEAYLFGTAAALYDSKGEIVGAIESIRDITERKRAGEALSKAHNQLELKVKERTSELETRNAEMERFTYTVSHDLRSPLISISGFLGFLKQDAEKGDVECMKADLQIVNEAVTKMDCLLQDTLELSRIGRIVNPSADVPFGEIVKDALDLVAVKIHEKNVEIIEERDWPVVFVDKMRISEVLVNLIENSLKYMGDQPTPEIELGRRLDGEKTVFFVRDNGIGIDPSQYDKVFGLFYKVDKESKGTGVGLAIVKRIIEVHGGRIWIESELGKGCTMCFTLPLA